MKKEKSMRLVYRLLLLIGVVAVIEFALYGTRDAETGGVKQAAEQPEKAPTLEVTHSLQKNDLHLKMKVTGFTYSIENMGKENRPGEGHIHIYLDGKKVAKAFEDNYIVKNIPSGSHDVVVELAHNNHESYGIKQEFRVEVKP
ncbi:MULTISPECIES: hypothetical protein [Brevibacillus]|uniref:DUF4399 domain-containing protein n=1 Tax=Brevibacillus borstelensis AK1 TaxID=1300222 RepID=M8E3D1_9BACL|nr:hypothetical protein [Brevibacillus borstelensis]EMT53786.1 hypothetical protein I532_07220 [Brevibacillus borstelensis AK1]KKX56810.1 hypothetical protein X546_02225 [Brevibacillus borstelensis cifa_chp40]MBE5394699.1 hypothetical protein [Brevibacillus borstelensis]MCC0562543.1 hypothetical protein [Brevibacillus borstelensis]MCM3469849.1 hypothetical protein [Brevibacillus borstelensis]